MIQKCKKNGNDYLVTYDNSKSLFVPNLDENRHYKEILEWVKNGGIVEEEFTEKEMIDTAIKEKKIELKNSFNTNASLITTALPHEMASWDKQESQARAWNDDNTVVTPIIDELLTARNFGETKQDLVNKIIGNADAYEVVYGQLLGKYQNLISQVDSATTIADVEAIILG